ncbi:hypothetical protein BB560_002311 [Smittium megazygosporum]|uniref:Major facilitator superfamily (MFS) profile domain-containing protein n=1 Tax=Smittium megazygosporum TaxID=133381 RepID=A0A2T9ZF87_9FUNG|nr:hypothetical protein BB560_007081 [Smittium megazygosporum]PVV03225.1 hypothetical protein BB560_002311 [Smittium megazygosporum]
MSRSSMEETIHETKGIPNISSLPTPITGKNETPPDQGYAWAVALGGIFVMTVIFGCSNGFGVFQEHYLNVMFASESALKISWISTTSFVVTSFLGPFVGPLVRTIGSRPTSLLSCALCTGGLIGASFAKSIGTLVLTRGFIFGIGASIGINTSIVMISLWFQKHRPLVLATGMSLGGFGAIIIVLVVRRSIDAWGLDWSFRLLALIAFVGLFYGAIVFKTRTTYNLTKKIIDFKLLKQPLALTIVFNAFFNVVGWLTVSIYFSSVLVQLGKSQTTANNALLILSACTGLGRFFSTFFAKSIGINTALLLTNSICAIATFALWLPLKNYAVYIVFVVIFGLFYGFFFSLSPMLIASNYSPTQISQLNGLVYLFGGMGCLIWVPSLGRMIDSIGHPFNKLFEYPIFVPELTTAFNFFNFLPKFNYRRKNKESRGKSNTDSWMDLQMRHPDIKLGLQDIGKIRMECYWTAQRLAKAGLIPKMYIERCPFCNKNTPEAIKRTLIECFRWNSIRHETTIFNIPRLYRTVTIDQSTNNQVLNQGTATRHT